MFVSFNCKGFSVCKFKPAILILQINNDLSVFFRYLLKNLNCFCGEQTFLKLTATLFVADFPVELENRQLFLCDVSRILLPNGRTHTNKNHPDADEPETFGCQLPRGRSIQNRSARFGFVARFPQSWDGWDWKSPYAQTSCNFPNRDIGSENGFLLPLFFCVKKAAFPMVVNRRCVTLV